MAGGKRDDGLSVDDGVRALLLLLPQMIGRIKRIPLPEELKAFALTPRHLSLLSTVLFDGPLGVNELATRLEVAPTTVSLMVGDLSRRGVLERRADDADRRRTIVSIAPAHQKAIEDWLAFGAKAWRGALAPLSPAERRMFVDTLHAYNRATAADRDEPADGAAGSASQ